MSSNDEYLDKFRISIVDYEWIKFNFDYLQDYFRKNHDFHFVVVVIIL
jgi:hypothetical protein